MTIYEVKRIYEQKQKGYYFTRKTMKFFNQTLKQFSVIKIDSNNYKISCPIRNKYNKIIGISEKNFNLNTGKLTGLTTKETKIKIESGEIQLKDLNK